MAIRQVIYRDNAWARGFVLATLFHWIIILLLIWWWTSYQESDTVQLAKFCLVVDKEPVISQVPGKIIVREKSCPKPVEKIIITKTATPVTEASPVMDDRPPSGSLEEDRKRVTKAYIQRLQLKIAASRYYPPKSIDRGEEGTALLEFNLYKDGSVKDKKIIESSGYQRLDEASIDAITKAVPFEPIPQIILDAIKKEYWTFRIPIAYSLYEEQKKIAN